MVAIVLRYVTFGQACPAADWIKKRVIVREKILRFIAISLSQNRAVFSFEAS